jgi:hypothetical protein
MPQGLELLLLKHSEFLEYISSGLNIIKWIIFSFQNKIFCLLCFQFAFKTRSELLWTNFCIFISTIVRYINFAQTLIMVVKRNAKIAIPVICDMKKKSFLIAPLHWNALALCQIKKFLQTWQKMQNLILQIALFTSFCIMVSYHI